VTYEPKHGDRVRIVYEGTVGWVGKTGAFELTGAQNDHQADDGTRISVEKLPDPKPEWVNGDVIEVTYDRGGNYERPRIAVRVNGRWVLTDSAEEAGQWFIHNHWPEDVKILYKADG
jgi:hypothetical protein